MSRKEPYNFGAPKNNRPTDSSGNLGYRLFINGVETTVGTREEIYPLYEKAIKIAENKVVQVLFVTKKRFSDRIHNCMVEHQEVEVVLTNIKIRHSEYVVKSYYSFDGALISTLTDTLNQFVARNAQDYLVRQFLFDRALGKNIS